MMIVNKTTISKVIKTNKILGNYLAKNGFPLLQRDENKMIFSKTKNLEQALEQLPLSIKLFGRWEE